MRKKIKLSALFLCLGVVCNTFLLFLHHHSLLGGVIKFKCYENFYKQAVGRKDGADAKNEKQQPNHWQGVRAVLQFAADVLHGRVRGGSL